MFSLTIENQWRHVSWWIGRVLHSFKLNVKVSSRSWWRIQRKRPSLMSENLFGTILFCVISMKSNWTNSLHSLVLTDPVEQCLECISTVLFFTEDQNKCNFCFDCGYSHFHFQQLMTSLFVHLSCTVRPRG